MRLGKLFTTRLSMSVAPTKTTVSGNWRILSPKSFQDAAWNMLPAVGQTCAATALTLTRSDASCRHSVPSGRLAGGRRNFTMRIAPQDLLRKTWSADDTYALVKSGAFRRRDNWTARCAGAGRATRRQWLHDRVIERDYD